MKQRALDTNHTPNNPAITETHKVDQSRDQRMPAVEDEARRQRQGEHGTGKVGEKLADTKKRRTQAPQLT